MCLYDLLFSFIFTKHVCVILKFVCYKNRWYKEINKLNFDSYCYIWLFYCHVILLKAQGPVPRFADVIPYVLTQRKLPHKFKFKSEKMSLMMHDGLKSSKSSQGIFSKWIMCKDWKENIAGYFLFIWYLGKKDFFRSSSRVKNTALGKLWVIIGCAL